MITPPYLRDEDLTPRMIRRPMAGFFLKPASYRVVDGDTLEVLAGASEGGKREGAFKIRLASVNCPELPTTVPQQKILQEIGLEPHNGHPGAESAKAVRAMMKGRAIFVEPVKDRSGMITDRYGRLTARVCVSGTPGPLFDAKGATPLENWLLEKGLGHQMSGKPEPIGMPPVLSHLLREARYRAKMESYDADAPANNADQSGNDPFTRDPPDRSADVGTDEFGLPMI